ncbi:FimV/HubP family polar landmark protein [Nitrincola sp.]|uniref:FimV/HubP family polar landmark protein n=1 Tax=Nitrincola sp. TaxID=1926584 RepID=UPI003A9589A8
MLRKLALSLAIAGVLGVPNANALGLGEINISSALNEPLNAEIRLMQVRDLSPLQIQPRMADADEFSIAGLSKSRFLNDVRFQVQVSPDGAGVIRMTSTEPVREPFLNFLVEVNWPNGRLVREYTVLLDPPLFDPAPVRGQVQPAVSSAPVAVAPATTSARPSPEPRALPTTANQVHVGANDTLWVLANRHRPDSSITPQQMMIALQRHNPQTFPTANINIMRAGTVMDIPSVEQIRALSPAEATAEVARQTEAWRQGRSQPAAPQPASEPETTTPEASEESQDEVEAETEVATEAEAEALAETAEALVDVELRIVTPESEVADTEQESPVAGDMASRDEVMLSSEVADGLLQRSEDLDSRLMVTQETVDKIERENRDLNEKLDAIQEQLILMQRMLELKEQQIAAMQTVEPEPPTEKGLVDKLTSLPVVGGLVAALVAALLALLLSRRRRDTTPKPLFTAPEGVSGDKAAVAAAGVAVAATVAAEEKQVEQPVAEKAAEASVSADTTDDFSDLDLDLDLDLELNEDDDTRVVDEEYDLSAENDFDDLLGETELGDEPAVEELDVEESQSDAEPVVGEDEDELLDDLLNYEEPELKTDSVEPTEDHSEDELGSLDDLLMSDEAGADEDLIEDEPEAPVRDDSDELDFILNEPEKADSAEAEVEAESTADDDLDSLLGSMEIEDIEVDAAAAEVKTPGETVEDELTANIAHDLETGLDDELEDLLSSTDDDIALEEYQSTDEAIDMLDGLNLLDGADENETKLDLARAYLEMDDAEGAREILGEILGEGNDKQKEEAQKLLDSLS